MKNHRSVVGAWLTTALLTACSGTSNNPLSPNSMSGPLIPASSTSQLSKSSPKRLPPPPSTYQTLYSFKGGSDGSDPDAALFYLSSTLYGTTYAGGGNVNCSGGCGTVFSITPCASPPCHEGVLHDFGDTGQYLFAGLLDVNGTFYGTTDGGGKHDDGTVFSLTPQGVLTLLYRFVGGAQDGAGPNATLIDVNGTLYGTTTEGGAYCETSNGCGTVFWVTPCKSPPCPEGVLHSFGQGSDGSGPFASLFDVNGTLYGTTSAGGKSFNGTVYSITLQGVETPLYSFKGGSDGAFPYSALIDVNGRLYGTTYQGGGSGCSEGCGTVYSISTSGTEHVLHRFGTGASGSFPWAGLLNVGTLLYGTTAGGGKYSGGTLFSITTSGTDYTMLHPFGNGTDGSDPLANVIDASGTLYGTTRGGGTNKVGTVFAFTP